ncbi:MAG: asparagine synthase (glutamine-hydrolyzing) [Dethiobacter sp.]|nr:asparagine synthase (glutamine-hydrolyzing) [Dethiobacter sp.]
MEQGLSIGYLGKECRGLCGLFGIWYKSAGSARLDMERVTSAFAHRGPDGEGNADFGTAALGFRRLSIIDLARGAQPMYNEDGKICLVFNGEIYNYRMLREELLQKGHKFKSDSDSEVLVHLYEEEGEECVKRLRGMFAFCIYDTVRGVLFGARDRFGIKPLYYLETREAFAVASEAKALLDVPGYSVAVNEAAIPHYLTFQYVPEPATMFAGIYKIPPAHTFTYSNGKLATRRYWQVEFNPQDRSLDEFIEGTRQVLRESVKLHTQADVPWGAFLSGGIDSTIIVALLRELGTVSTFSVGYEDQHYSELTEAADTARYLETDHEEYLIKPEGFWQELPRLIWHFDDPVADPAAISLFFVARMARKKITVTLSGEGADEVFGGYGIYREPYALRPLSWLPSPLLAAVGGGSRLLPSFVPGKNYLRRAATPLEKRYVGNALIFSEEEKRQLLKKRNFPPASVVTQPLYDRIKGLDDVAKMQYIDLHTWMVGDILVKADKMTMANSLELRVPYLDHHVFEFAAAIPAKFKIRGGLTKYLLRQAFAGIVPPAAVNRPKRGFPVPTRVWLRGKLGRQAAEIVSAPEVGRYFSRPYIQKLLSDHAAGRVDNSRKIWTLVIFALWQEQFLTKKAKL